MRVLRVGDGALFSIELPDGYSSILLGRSPISPTSDRIVFRASPEEQGPARIFSVPIEGPGSEATLLSLAPETSPYVHSWEFGADGSHVVYLLSARDPVRYELYAVPANGPPTASYRLRPVEDLGENTTSPYVFREQARVLFWLFGTTPERTGWWSTDLAEAGAVPLALDSSSYPLSFERRVMASDETRVVWTTGEGDIPALFSLACDDPPSPIARLTPDLPPLSQIYAHKIAPSNDWVAYISNQTDPEKYELHSVPAGGPASASRNLSGFSFSSNFGQLPFGFSSDGSRVLYVADREVEGRFDLYHVPVGGPSSASQRLNVVPTGPYGVDRVQPLPDGSGAVFDLIEGDAVWKDTCHRARFSEPPGSSEPLWSMTLRASGSGPLCDIVPAASAVLTVAFDPASGLEGLWLAHLDGPLDPRPLLLADDSGFEPGASGPFDDVLITRDGRWAIHRGRRPSGDEDLFRVALPFFWDGFEAGTTDRWIVQTRSSEIADGSE